MLRTSYICLLKEVTQSLTMASLGSEGSRCCQQQKYSAIRDNIIGRLVWLSYWATSYESYFTGIELENTFTTP